MRPIPATPSAPPPAARPSPPRYQSRKLSGPDRNPANIDLARPTPPISTATPTDEEILTAALATLKKGNLAYSTPTSMKTGKTAHVVARIGGDSVSIDTLQAGMPVDQGQKVALAATPVSAKMKMTLAGADFDITPLSSEEQIVAGTTPTQWEWDIVPRHSGDLRIHLAAVVELNNIAKDFTSIDRDIVVLVDPMGAATTFVTTNWQWLIASLVTVCGAGWKYLSSRKKTA